MGKTVKLTGIQVPVDTDLLVEKLEEAFFAVTGIKYDIQILEINPGEYSDDVHLNACPMNES